VSPAGIALEKHLSEQRVDACRIVGDDSALSAALRAKVCDGVISGVACAVPELTLALYNRGEQDDQQSLPRPHKHSIGSRRHAGSSRPLFRCQTRLSAWRREDSSNDGSKHGSATGLSSSLKDGFRGYSPAGTADLSPGR
jgi:hypothetical protein